MSKTNVTGEDPRQLAVVPDRGPTPPTLANLARDHHAFLLALARKLTRGNFDAEDLVQDVLVKTVTHFATLTTVVNHRAWMTQVMKNLFVDQVRRRKTRDRMDPLELEAVVPEETAWWMTLDGGDVRAAVAKLPDELRETFDRFALRGESYQAISEALAIPKATVGTRILRARRRLKQLLLEHGALR
jgi:RNA polymerase sigma-70 factor (ECF subfamily)